MAVETNYFKRTLKHLIDFYSKDEVLKIFIKEIKDKSFEIGVLNSELIELKDHNAQLRIEIIKLNDVIKNQKKQKEKNKNKKSYDELLKENYTKLQLKYNDLLKVRDNLIAQINK